METAPFGAVKSLGSMALCLDLATAAMETAPFGAVKGVISRRAATAVCAAMETAPFGAVKGSVMRAVVTRRTCRNGDRSFRSGEAVPVPPGCSYQLPPQWRPLLSER